jgi:hypothetical protein
MTTKKPSDVAKIPELCMSLAPHRGVPTKPLRIMIMGIPNVGKSTLMNALLKKRVAKVGDEPAVTKAQQKLYLDKNTVLVDTPGMLWPKIAMASDGLMLAASHAIGSNALIEEEVAEFLGDAAAGALPAAADGALRLQDRGHGRHRRGRRRGGAPRLPRAEGRRPRLREGGARLPAGLPHRRAGPHQPGDAARAANRRPPSGAGRSGWCCSAPRQVGAGRYSWRCAFSTSMLMRTPTW